MALHTILAPRSSQAEEEGEGEVSGEVRPQTYTYTDTDTDTGEFLEVSRYATSTRMKVHNVTTIYQPQPAIAI